MLERYLGKWKALKTVIGRIGNVGKVPWKVESPGNCYRESRACWKDALESGKPLKLL